MSEVEEVCENCAVGSNDDETVQKRDCGHVLCEACCEPCPVCAEEA
jgi:hypothetical protein